MPSRAASATIRPEDFGAKGDGVADDGPAFRLAASHCAATGARLVLANLRYRGARLEVHQSFDVEGNGARIDHLGIGNTLIGGMGTGLQARPTIWPGIDHDAMADVYPVISRRLLRDGRDGDSLLQVKPSVLLAAGEWIFLAVRATSMSSAGPPGNFIPRDFAFHRVVSTNGDLIRIDPPLAQDFARDTAVFVCGGLARDCVITDLEIVTSSDAYQHVVRSAVNVDLRRIVFTGGSAVGACTFARDLRYLDCRATGAFAGLSAARGTESLLIDGFHFDRPEGGQRGEPTAIFVEESFGAINLRRVVARTGGLSVRSMERYGAPSRGRFRASDCVFDTRTSPEGATTPLPCGTAIGADFAIERTRFSGAARDADQHFYPGVHGPALTWMSALGALDRLRFTDCTFESMNGGAAFAKGGGVLGKVKFAGGRNRYVNCAPAG